MKAGASKADITPKTRDIAMLGYGKPDNTARDVETPISARSVYIEDDDGDGVFFLNLEICFVTDSIFRPLVELAGQIVGKDMSDKVIITANHTHSAPGGYDHYPLYNMPTPGFCPEVLEAILKGGEESMRQAFQKKEEAKLGYLESEFSPNIEVAFNRSMKAYQNNPEVAAEGLPLEPELAVDRTSRLIQISGKDGKPLAFMNWFGVHATSIPSYVFSISPDNKGYAALEVEKRHPGSVALFNQGKAGDVSPNYVWDEELKRKRGPFEDPIKNARLNGKLQANKALDMAGSGSFLDIAGKIQSSLIFRDMSKVVPSSKFLPEDAPVWARGESASHGVAFAQGTMEGPGTDPATAFILKIACTFEKLASFISSFQKDSESRERQWHYYLNQEPKSVFVNAGSRKLLGIENILKIPLLDKVDPLMATMKEQFKANGLGENSWIQEKLPVQVVKIDKVLFATLPGEASTMAGNRMEKQLQEFFGDEIEKIIIAPYCNSYCGYIVTPEEYEIQAYEGGHTVFGKWTLPVFQTVLEEACRKLKNPEMQVVQELPEQFSEAVLRARAFSR